MRDRDALFLSLNRHLARELTDVRGDTGEMLVRRSHVRLHLPTDPFELWMTMKLQEPDETLLQQNIAAAFAENRFEDAVALLEPIAWSREDPEMFNNLGALMFQLQRFTEAEAAFKTALRIDPLHATAATNLADQYLHEGLPYSAMQILEKTLATLEEADDATGTALRAQLDDLRERFPVRRVSIYTPGYLCEDVIARCIESIRNQTYPVHEILLVDDCSPDRSTEIAESMGVRIIRHTENLGLAASCNTALRHCQGEFLAKIDTDLELDPSWLERAMIQFEDPAIAGVGGRLLEHRTIDIPDQWRRICMEQHHGANVVLNPRFLYGADCIFRVRALRAIKGWNEKYRTNYEDVDLSTRLKQAGFNLIYEPRAIARHLRRDTIGDVLHNCWKWQYNMREERGHYQSIETCIDLVDVNRSVSVHTSNGLLKQNRATLLYPSFLLYFWWCIADLDYLRKNHRIDDETFGQTALGLFLLTRYSMLSLYTMPASLTERLLRDLHAYLAGILPERERRMLSSEEALEHVASLGLASQDAVLESIPAHLPKADPDYLKAFADKFVPHALGPGMGALVAASADQLSIDEGWEERRRSGTLSTIVLLNPPAHTLPGLSGPGDGMARLRWKHPSRMKKLADKLSGPNRRVILVDAVDENLDVRETLERVMGAEPEAILYSMEESETERAVAMARMIRLCHPRGPRQILIDAPDNPSFARSHLMFHEIHKGWPDEDHPDETEQAA